MKNREIQKLVNKYLIPQLKGYVARGRLLIYTPFDFFLRGYCFEGSSFAHDHFTVCAFVQPLYVPCDHIILSYGKRLGSIVGKSEKWWEIDWQNAPVVMNDVLSVMQAQAEPVLKLCMTPKLFMENLHIFHTNKKDLYRQEIIAYSFVLEGDLLRARKSFIRLMPNLELGIREGALGAFEIKDRAQLIFRHIEHGDLDGALKQLFKWADYTMRNLKIPKLINKQKELS